MSCYIRILNPDINEKWFLGMSSVFKGKNELYAFLYIPDKQYAVCTDLSNRKPNCKRITQADFTSKLEGFKTRQVKCLLVKEVRVPSVVADRIGAEAGSHLNKAVTDLSKQYFAFRR